MVRLLFLLTFFNLSFQNLIAAGVEFKSSEIEIGDELISSFKEGLKEVSVDEKTGYNVFKYFNPNSKYPYLTIVHNHGLTMKHIIDSNSDGQPDQIKQHVEGERYTYEELMNIHSSEKGFHYRRRYYPLEGTNTARRIIEYRESINKPFKVTANSIVSHRSFASERNSCTETVTSVIDDVSLVVDIEDVVNSFGISWHSAFLRGGKAKFRVEVESSCNEKASRHLDDNVDFGELYGETINEGLNCLRRMAEGAQRTAGVNFLYRNALAALVGQQTYVVPRSIQDMDPRKPGFPRISNLRDRNNMTIVCSEPGSRFGRRDGGLGLGYASNGRNLRPTNLKCSDGDIAVTHPFMSLNFGALSELRISSDREKRRHLQKVIFHEFLHTAGWDHNDFWDPVESCASACFGVNVTQGAREYCMGENGAAGLTGRGLNSATVLNFQQLQSQNVPNARALQELQNRFNGLGLPANMMPANLGGSYK